MPMALTELHTGATYYMNGSPYEVTNLSMSGSRLARLKKVELHRAGTRPKYMEKPTIAKILDTKTMWNTQIAHCTLNIHMTVSGYYKRRSPNQEDLIPLDVPLSYSFFTKGLAFCAPIPDILAPKNNDKHYSGFCHAVEHVIIEGGNMITGGAAQDMGGISLGDSGAIFVYDGAIGGNGATKVLYDKIEKVVQRSSQILKLCPCMGDSGCPRCTYSYRCGRNNEPLHKIGALRVLEGIMDGNVGRLDGTLLP